MSFIAVLKGTNGLLGKRQVLRSANFTDRQVLMYAYDKALTFGVTFDFIDWANVKDDDSVELFSLLDTLNARELTGNAARKAVEDHAAKYGDIIKLICNKDLDCGVSYGLIESVFGKSFLNRFAVQLAKEVPLDKLKYPLHAQIKYDGVRVVAIVENSSVTFKTRNGKAFKCPKLEAQIRSIPRVNSFDNFILDGELIESFTGPSVEGRTSISGRVNSAIHGGILSGDFQFVVFDYMTLAHFKAQKCPWDYNIRMIDCLNKLYPDERSYENIFIATSKLVNSAQEANEYYAEVAKEGLEGIILKSGQHLYKFKRSADWVKVKAILDADLTCIDIIPGTGKYEGLIGSLVCVGRVNGTQVSVNVGSGLSDCQRSFPHDHYIGNTVEVQYNCIIQDLKTGGYSLFLPRFIRMRFDK